ncbi:hypothetical protein yberc0001_4750 [Yersinia bercovieri ATCC 43970]|uniref:Uncharacterized protein n=1 Tax=Yersinia bercovieri ATCC 43970 TaxID=349968 RepID=A0ABM9XVT8_YERBE|nr:hypothetical protein yberc0001_4750 [Yersinia bercovieri ATCC 43970]
MAINKALYVIKLHLVPVMVGIGALNRANLCNYTTKNSFALRKNDVELQM